jgi:hypothetical protein
MKGIILYLNIFFGILFVEPFIFIIFYLYRNFGFIGLKDKYFINKTNIYRFYSRKDHNSNISSKNILVDNLLINNDVYEAKLKKWWKKKMKSPINFDNPKTFNEKIQWLKLYDSTPIKILLSDKYKVRDYIAKKIGKEYLNTLYGVYDTFEDINFNILPNKFVIKCNHGSGYNIIVKDKSKLNLKVIKEKLDKWMNENFALAYGLELHYRDIKPKIIIEKYLDDGTGDLRDYKITCF